MSDSSNSDLPPLFALNHAEVGRSLMRSVCVSAALGHVRPAYTEQDYVDREQQSPEGKFVFDVLTRPTKEICDRWYGSVMNASVAASELVAMALGVHTPEDLDRLREDGPHAA